MSPNTTIPTGTSREVILSIFTPTGAPRNGLSFDFGRRDDLQNGNFGDPAGYQPLRYTEGEIEYYDDIWGNLWHRMKDGCVKGEIIRPALEEWSMLDGWKPPQFDRESATANLKKSFGEDDGRFRIAWMPGWIFASARYLRRLENYLLDMALYPEELHRLHAKIATVFEPLIGAAADAGADAIAFCEDLGTQKDLLFSPEMWEEYFGETYRRLFALAHQKNLKVFMHSCGQNRKLLEPLLKAGVDCFQFDQPRVYDFKELSGLLNRYHAALWSPVDIQQVLPSGDRRMIEAEAQAMNEAFTGRLIAKNYPDLPGIGVKLEWDNWAYNVFCN